VTYFGAGIVALALLVMLAWGFVALDARVLVRFIRYGLGIAMVAAGVTLVFGGRWGVGGVLAALGVSALSTGRIGPFNLGGVTRTPGSISTVRSAWFEMRLDHDTGAMEGRVLRGEHAGRQLDDLDDGTLLGLFAGVAGDGESRALLEAYVDRRVPGWREHVEPDSAAGAGGAADSGPMTDEQAYEILGLAPGAGKAEIAAAHRRLMKRVHPDQGGSTFLAAKINQAKDWLLGKHR
jgi:hypothetical protein